MSGPRAAPPPRHGYQYVVLRAVPSVVREEFINVGVLLYSQMARFLDVAYEVDRARAEAFSPRLDADELQARLAHLARLCEPPAPQGRPDLRPLGKRFGWLAAPRSTVLQPGPVHGGMCDDPADELQRLLAVLVRRPGRC